MQDPNSEPVPMLRFVLAFFAMKVLAASGLAIYAIATGADESPISPTPITIAAVGAALLWFVRVVNRPMSSSEIVKFSLGNVIADVSLSVAWGLGMIWMLSEPLSWEGVDAVLGGNGNGDTARLVLATGLGIGSIQVFALSAFFAWLITRKLPRTSSPSKGFE
jgi:hypothetical protein